MADYVVDTNVWVMVDRNIADIKKVSELDCLDACRKWLNNFSASDDRLVIDMNHKILGEYRHNIMQGGTAVQFLNRLETQPRHRLVEYLLPFDSEGYAVLPVEFLVVDPDDRVFVAAALAHQPYAPIVYATDSDWEKARPALENHGLTLIQLCSAYIQEKIERDSSG